MKKFLGLLLIFKITGVFACDGCNVYTPSGLNNTRHKIGIYSRQRITYGEFSQLGEMLTKHSGHTNDQVLWGTKVSEYYQTFELRGDFFLREKFQLTVVLPVTHNCQKLDGNKRFSISGLSDPTLMLGYHFTRENVRGIKQRLVLGSGARLPIGLTSIDIDGFIPDLDFQPGSGAFSWLSYANYFITDSKWSGSISVNYKKNGFNKYNYQYGQTFNTKIDGFWQTDVKEHTLMFQLGGYAEFSDLDHSIVAHNDTGGRIWFGTLGINHLSKNFVIQTEFQPVIFQNLNGNTQLFTKNRINVGLIYVL